MGKGRKPLPTKLKLLRGNPGKRKLNAREPSWQALESERSPRWLDQYAKEEWKKVLPEMQRVGTATEVGKSLLATYCIWAAIVRRAEELVDGKILVAVDGKPKPHPAIELLAMASRESRAWAVEFGLTPSSASRVVSNGPQGQDALEQFLSSG